MVLEAEQSVTYLSLYLNSP